MSLDSLNRVNSSRPVRIQDIHRAQLLTTAYLEAVHPLFLSALIVSFGAVIAGFFASNFFLGKSHNAVETDKIVNMRGVAPPQQLPSATPVQPEEGTH